MSDFCQDLSLGPCVILQFLPLDQGPRSILSLVSSGPNQRPPSLRADSGGEGHSGEVEGIAAATGLLVGVVVRLSNSKSPIF